MARTAVGWEVRDPADWAGLAANAESRARLGRGIYG